VAPSTSGSFYVGPRPRSFASTPMPTRRVVPTRVGPPRAMPCSSEIASSPGRQSASWSSPALASRPSTAPWQTAWLRRPGSVSCSKSSTVRWQRAPWSSATTSAPSTSPPTPSSTSARNMSRSIFIRQRTGRLWSCSCSSRPDRLPVRRRLHQGASVDGVCGVSVQSQHLQWLEFRLRRGVLECLCIWAWPIRVLYICIPVARVFLYTIHSHTNHLFNHIERACIFLYYICVLICNVGNHLSNSTTLVLSCIDN
jgi:hypothetical protein